MARHTSIKFATETMRRAGLEAAVGQRTTHSSKSAPLAPEILAFDPQSILWRQAGVRYTDSQVLSPTLWYAEGGRWTEGPNFPDVGVHPAYDYERPRRDARSRWFREVVTSSPTRRTMLNRLRLCMEEILKCPDFPWPLPHSVASSMYEKSSRPASLTTTPLSDSTATVESASASLAVSSATTTSATTVPPLPQPQTLRWHHKPSAETSNMPPASHDALLLTESTIDEHRQAMGQTGGRSPGDLPVRPELARREFRQEFFRSPAPPPTVAGPRPLAPAPLPGPLLPLLTQKHRPQEDPAHILQIARQQQLQLQLQSQLAEKMADTSGADELLSLYADNDGEDNEAMDDQEDDAGDEETTSEVEEGEVVGNAEPASDDQEEGDSGDADADAAPKEDKEEEDEEQLPPAKPSQAHDYVSAVLSLSQKGALRKTPTAVTLPAATAAATKSSPAKKPAAPRSNGGGGGGGSKKRKTPEPAAAADATDAEEGAEAEATEEAAAAAPPKKKRAPAKSKAQRQKEAATSANKAAGIDHEASPSDSVVDHINDIKTNMEEITQLRQDMAAFTHKVGVQLASMDPQQAFEKISEFLAGLLKTTDPDVLEGVSDLIAMLVDHATILPLKSRSTYGSDLSEARQKEIKQERVTMGKVVHVFGRAPNATPGPNPFDWKDYRKRHAEKKKREAAEAAAAAKAKSAAAAQAKKPKVSSIADENPF